MASKTTIINQALKILANERITGPNDTAERAQTMLELYDDALDVILADHPWNFALHYATLAAEPAAPAHTWGFQYLLPTDPYVLAVWEPRQDEIPWKIVGRRLYTNQGSSLDIVGTVRIVVDGLMSPHCADALSAKLAQITAYEKSRGTAMWDRLTALFLDRLALAKSVDGRQGQVETRFESSFTAVRG